MPVLLCNMLKIRDVIMCDCVIMHYEFFQSDVVFIINNNNYSFLQVRLHVYLTSTLVNSFLRACC